ncbi:MAG: methyltransferase domain-containing protein [Propionibacterium sp.]|nr:methyltransferase domain-containing protein [Propionibacterium sp.]
MERDEAIHQYYSQDHDESRRLTRSGQGRLEFERTQAIVRAATPRPARILDIGGGPGTHAAALAEAGYDVVLVDVVEALVEEASAHGSFEALVGDARSLAFDDASFDAVLMAGPLYHLHTRADRLLALREAARVCRPGGAVHAAAIPRLVAFADMTTFPEFFREFAGQLMTMMLDGTPPVLEGTFPAGHFHTADELESEMTEAGLVDVEVVGLEGPNGLAMEFIEVGGEEYAAAKHLAEAWAGRREIANMSSHLFGTGRV